MKLVAKNVLQTCLCDTKRNKNCVTIFDTCEMCCFVVNATFCYITFNSESNKSTNFTKLHNYLLIVTNEIQ